MAGPVGVRYQQWPVDLAQLLREPFGRTREPHATHQHVIAIDGPPGFFPLVLDPGREVIGLHEIVGAFRDPQVGRLWFHYLMPLWVERSSEPCYSSSSYPGVSVKSTDPARRSRSKGGPSRLGWGAWHGTRPGMRPPRAFATATSTGRPSSSFARPGRSVSTGSGGRPVQSGAESTAPAGLRPRGTRGCCSGCPARSCCGWPAGSSSGGYSSYRPGSPGTRPWPSTVSDCKTRLRQRQLDVEPARAKAITAEAVAASPARRDDRSRALAPATRSAHGTGPATADDRPPQKTRE